MITPIHVFICRGPHTFLPFTYISTTEYLYSLEESPCILWQWTNLHPPPVDISFSVPIHPLKKHMETKISIYLYNWIKKNYNFSGRLVLRLGSHDSLPPPKSMFRNLICDPSRLVFKSRLRPDISDLSGGLGESFVDVTEKYIGMGLPKTPADLYLCTLRTISRVWVRRGTETYF